MRPDNEDNRPATVGRTADELIASDPKVTASLAHWQTVTEFSLSPSGTTVKDGQKVKADGKSWRGPRAIRNLRWDGGDSAHQKTTDAALRPEEFQKNFNDSIKKSLEQHEPGGLATPVHYPHYKPSRQLGTTTFTDTNVVVDPTRFYRVAVNAR